MDDRPVRRRWRLCAASEARNGESECGSQERFQSKGTKGSAGALYEPSSSSQTNSIILINRASVKDICVVK
ncbi:hypothetical protein ACPOL_6272 [Acidisarcina polymorpha]|uniref:Uncharacterized protein n=1 Tax=Acidisarcina polymorpha TaxID=2211140 RepID=A0A2Z5G8A2_9BACT|nr:hypothetical protein ACPOL_6272 [Acidisarcina polymorpha]